MKSEIQRSPRKRNRNSVMEPILDIFPAYHSTEKINALKPMVHFIVV
jgi:hypothetical protein